MDLQEAKARLAELDRKSRVLEEKIEKDGDTRGADEDLKGLE